MQTIIRFFLVVTSFATCMIPAEAQSAAGFLDYSFGSDGKVVTSFSSGGFNHGNRVLELSDGKILVAGITYHDPSYRFSVLKYLSNGTPDLSFGTNGRASMTATSVDKVAGIIVLPDGNIVVGVTNFFDTGTGAKPHFALLRFTRDGFADTTFGTGGKVVFPALSVDRDNMTGLAVQSDGKFVMTGDTGNPTPNSLVVLRSDSNGTLDPTFDGDGILLAPIGPSNIADFGAGLTIQPDGKIIVVGDGWETGRDVLLLRLNGDGTFDHSFGGDGIVTTRVFGQASRGYAVALQPDGKIVVAGEVISTFLVLRYNSNGSLDSTFDSDGFNYTGFGGTHAYASSLAIQPNGQIVVGGYADGPGTSDLFAIARFRSNGSIDTSFSGDGLVRTAFGNPQSNQDKIRGLTLQRDGKLIAVGDGATFPPSITIARYRTMNGSISDFDGDGRSDLSVYRPSNGQWWLNRSSEGVIASTFGLSDDRITPSDFTGDGKADVAIWRPLTGEWFVLRSEDSTYYSFPFGLSDDLPVVGDFDGDSKSDAAVFRPSAGTWFISRSSDGGMTIVGFGGPGDLPAAADYDGDGKADIAIYRPSLGQWWINRSTAGVIVHTFGVSTDKITPGDYTGDGRADVAFWRQSTGEWFVLRSENDSYYAYPFGIASDIPAAGDFDGDSKFDTAVFRPSSGNWFVLRSSDGNVSIQSFGATGDLPIQSGLVP